MNLRTLIPGVICVALAMTVWPVQAKEKQGSSKTSAASARHAGAQRTFESPDAAAKALVAAARERNEHEIVAIVGPSSKTWLLSGDKVADENDWADFVTAYDEKNKLDGTSEGRALLTVGNDDWPFPAPIVKRGSAWAFDAGAGREEFINRRVGRNELDAMQTLLAVVDAEREYAARDADGNGFPDYAKRIASTAGTRDGLYWPTKENEAESPLGPLVAAASREGYGKPGTAKPAPYHGYYYRLLTAQGKDASGGAYSYLVGDKLLGGFGVVAWPSSYGASGMMTFIVNHDGVVYEKDLGPQTAAIASAMTRFNPDKSWKKTSP
jgi:hypothetical protein